MENNKLTVPDLLRMKKEKRKIVLLSVPDAMTAKLAERAGVDIVALGDSMGMVTLGYSTTIPVTMEDMIRHGQAVRRGAPNTFFLVAMPYQSYQTPEIALRNATRLVQEVGADAVKVQGFNRVNEIIRAISGTGIPCMSHVGLIPHTVAMLGGFKAQGRTAEDAKRIHDDALAAQEAGAIGIEIEAVPPGVANEITKALSIITYGIGAGPGCDGQVLIGWDMLGFFDAFKPKFVKRYATLAEKAIEAITEFAKEVRDGQFPADEHTYSMEEDEFKRFKKLLNN